MQKVKLNILFLTLNDISVLDFLGYSIEESLPDTVIQTFEASSDLEAMQVLKSHRIDLIIADMNIDTIESYEFYDKLQLTNNYKNIPFIFLSSNEEDQEISLLKGISNFFLKPLNVDQLLNALNRILNEAKISYIEDEKDNSNQKLLLETIYSNVTQIEELLHVDNNKDKIKILTSQIKANISKLSSINDKNFPY